MLAHDFGDRRLQYIYIYLAFYEDGALRSIRSTAISLL